MELYRKLLIGLGLIWALVCALIFWWQESSRPPLALDAQSSHALLLASSPAAWQSVNDRRTSVAQLVAMLEPFRVELRAANGQLLEQHPAEVRPVPPHAVELNLPVTLPDGEGLLRIALPPRGQPESPALMFGLLLFAAGLLLAALWLWRALAGERQARRVIDAVLDGNREPDSIDRQIDHPAVNAVRLLLAENREYAQAQVQALDSVRRRSFVDADTQLGNRAYFDAHLEVQMRERDQHAHGVLLLLELGEPYRHLDSDAGDQRQRDLARLLAQLMRQHVREFPDPVLARRDQSSFSALIPGLLARDAGVWCKRLLRELRGHVERTGGEGNVRIAHIGVVAYRAGDDAYKLMSEADMALRVAQQEGEYIGWHVFGSGELAPDNVMGRVRWRALLEKVIEQRSVQFHYLPVLLGADKQLTHYEVLSRVPGENGALFTAATFIPMAHRVGLASAFDRMVCDRVIKSLLFGPPVAAPLFVNLSADAIADQRFRMWLAEHLAENRQLASKLVFEVAESVASHLEPAQHTFMEALVACGAALSVERVGHPQYSARYLEPGLYRYVKLHRSLTMDIENDAAHQDFIRGLTAVVQAAGAITLAECVESESQWQMLLTLGVQGGQGYYLGRALTTMPVKAETPIS